MKHWLSVVRLGATLALCAVLVVGSFPPAQAVQQPENDDAFDAEGYNGAPEDALETRPLNDFFPPLIWELDFQFDVDIDCNLGGCDSETETSLDQIFNTDLYTEEEQFQKQSEQNPPPRGNLQVSGAILEPGAEVTAVAQAEGFVTGDGQDLFYAWAFGGVSANGTAAGADPLDPPTASAPNATHARPTQSDADGDGMDDEWELRYGLDPSNAGDAGDDLDGDGYTNNVYDNEFGEVLTVTPPSTCGEEFNGSNLCEFIWGTDPYVADTDGDGFTDGQDIAGLGQITLTFAIPPDALPGDVFELRLTVLGHSMQQFDRETYLTKVDSQSVQIIVGDAEQLSATLTASNPTPIPGQQVTMTSALGETEFHPGLLTYSWFVNGQFQADASGESRSTFLFEVPRDSRPGDTITVGVRALNFTTQQESTAEAELRVSEVVQLQYDPTDVVPGKPYTVNAVLLSGAADPGELVFHWTKDGKPVPGQSGLGKTTFTDTTGDQPGDTFDLGLRVTTPSDSKTFGEVRAVVGVQQPQVDIITTDSFIEPGQTAELTAVPAHFKAEPLEFRWTVNGQAQDLPLETRTIDVIGTEINDVITVGVEVRTVGSSPDSASAVEFETVVPAGQLSLLPPTETRDVRAMLGAAAGAAAAHPLVATLGILGATGAVSLAIVARKRRPNV